MQIIFAFYLQLQIFFAYLYTMKKQGKRANKLFTTKKQKGNATRTAILETFPFKFSNQIQI